ncbi:hypothetical protein, partial [Putridiphycobacter roseus]
TPNLDSNERTGICQSCDLYERDFKPLIDSLYSLEDLDIHQQTNNYLLLYLYKTHLKPKLPAGGGSIIYNYIVPKTFYVE